MHTCGWCGKHYVNWQSQCDSCGGIMPALPGHEIGAPPPAQPRRLPTGFEFRIKWSRNVLAIVGAAFCLGGAVFTILVAMSAPWFAAIPALVLLGGFSMVRMGRREAARTIDSFRNGVAVAGRVVSVRMDTSLTVNGRHPFLLTYQFTADGNAYSGSVSSFDSSLGMRQQGQPLWVLHLRDDPTVNTVYPPMK